MKFTKKKPIISTNIKLLPKFNKLFFLSFLISTPFIISCQSSKTSQGNLVLRSPTTQIVPVPVPVPNLYIPDHSAAIKASTLADSEQKALSPSAVNNTNFNHHINRQTLADSKSINENHKIKNLADLKKHKAITSDYSVVFSNSDSSTLSDTAEIQDSENLFSSDNILPDNPINNDNDNDNLNTPDSYDTSSEKGLLCPNGVYYNSWRKQFDQYWTHQNATRFKSISSREKALSQARTSAFIHLVYPAIEKTGYDFPIEITPRVLSWIDYFTGIGRKNFVVWLRRGQSYIPEMEQTLEQNGLPKDLVYLSMIESGFSTKALSYAAAVGLWQFVPAAAKDYSLHINDYVDERRDPVKSTVAAAKYLSSLYTNFGSWHLATAAYNCGPGCVQRTLRHYGKDSSYFQLSSMGAINSQTANYVPKIIAAMIVAKNPDMFGFDASDIPKSMPTKQITLYRSIEIKDLARTINVDLDILNNLNPELRLGVTPPAKFTSTGVFQLTVPASKYEIALASVDNLPNASTTRMVAARIKKRESVSTFTNHYRVSLASFLRANGGLKSSSALYRGQVVYIPVSLGTGQYSSLTATKYATKQQKKSNKRYSKRNQYSRIKLSANRSQQKRSKTKNNVKLSKRYASKS